MSHTKGQISMEFMAYFGILLLIFVGFGPVMFSQAASIQKKSAAIGAGRTATILENEVNSAVRFGDGYQRNFTLPHKLSRQSYNITVTDVDGRKVLRVSLEETTEGRQLLATEISGSPSPGENSIENVNGEIIFGDV
ncbi:MAG: hypothetical protein ACLFM9_04100 [Candidatus Aenigmatarchaeota archaeon]